jgi:sugar lactone lactonase YvrE
MLARASKQEVECGPDTSMLSCFPSHVARLTHAALALVMLSSVLWVETAEAGPLSIAIPGARAFPESITSTNDGTLFVGRLGEGGIVRVNPRTGETTLFVAAGAFGSRSITGVYADEAHGTLWACSVDLSASGGPSNGSDRVSALKAFDLRTGAAKRSILLPGPHAFCNDIAIDPRGAAYVTDSAGPNVLRLRAGGSRFEVFASSPQFSPPQPDVAGLDGIAFGADGNLYVTTYATGGLFRISVERGRALGVTKLRGRPLALPDGLRPSGRGFLLVEAGAGNLDRVDIAGDAYSATPIRGDFRSPTSVTRVGSTAWLTEGQMPLFFDRLRAGRSPSLPFQIHAVSLSEGQSQ